MVRYDFLLYHRDVTSFLEQLRELGVVDITLGGFTPSDAQSQDIAHSKHLQTIAKALKSIKGEGEKFGSVEAAVEAYDQATKVIEVAQNGIVRAKADIEQIEMWGEFDPSLIDKLRGRGVTLRFFETTVKVYDSDWENDYAIDVIGRTTSKVFFVVAQPSAEAGELLPIEALELKAPTSSATQKEAEIEQFISQQVEAQKVVARVALSAEEIKIESLKLTEKIDFQKAQAAGIDEVEGTVKILECWSTVDDRAKIEEFANGQDMIYTVADAKAEQNPPIKLKNNFFARLYEPVGALYVLPKYDELDMTPFFAPFFMLFFGMCFGDAGYGLLLIVAIVALWSKIPAKFKDLAWLGIFLNLAAVIFGTLTGNVFGIELVKLQALAPYKEYFLDSDKVFVLSVVVGATQILFGMLLRVFNRIKRGGGKFVYGLSTIGWLMLFISSIVAFTEVGGEVYSTSSIAYYATLCAAGVLILFFNNPKKNLFVNFGAGLYNCYEMATGVAGDLISYVRLFAIGVAGTVIAQVFNELSVGMSGDIPVVSFIIMLIILAIGHGLNIFISILGAFVHPVRLTFVEFYKNSEFEGGGRKFTPFARKVKVEN